MKKQLYFTLILAAWMAACGGGAVNQGQAGSVEDSVKAPDDELVSGESPENSVRLAQVAVTSPQFKESFPQDGGFEIGLMPLDTNGNLLTEGVTLSGTVTSDPNYSLTVQLSEVREIAENDGSPLIVAMNFDSSSSMEEVDPAMERHAAGENFIDGLLSGAPESLLGIFDFSTPVRGGLNYEPGLGPKVDPQLPNPGFTASRLLWPWSSNTEEMKIGLDQLMNASGSRMNESLIEIMRYLEIAHPVARNRRRALVVLTDEKPNLRLRNNKLSDVIAKSQALSIPICPVGIDETSELSSNGVASSVDNLKTLGTRTGCFYTPAADAGSLRKIFLGLSKVLVGGEPVATVQINPVPPPGSVIRGEITVTDANGNSQSAPFTFTVPFVW